MLVSKIQPRLIAPNVTKRVMSKSQNLAERLNQITFPQAKAIIANPQKTSAIKAYGSGGPTTCDSMGEYSIANPDVFAC